MNVLVAVAGLLLATVVQVLVSGVWPALARFFDLPLLLVIYYGITKGPTGALLAGTGVGLLQDSLEGTLFGLSALSRATVGYLVGILGLRFALAPFVARVLVLAAATVLSSSIEVGTLALMGRRLAYSPFPTLLQTVVGNCLLGAPLLGLLAARRGLEGPE